jgi:hypothetical protein
LSSDEREKFTKKQGQQKPHYLNRTQEFQLLLSLRLGVLKMISTKQTQTSEKGKLKNSGGFSGCTVACGGGSFHLHINRAAKGRLKIVEDSMNVF